MDWLSGKVYFYRPDTNKKVDLNELLADLDYAYQRFGCTRIVIDSLHLMSDKEEYEYQDNVSRQLTNFAHSRSVHLALVCHAKIKELGEEKIPGQPHVEGSGGITRPVDNGVTIWRNVLKAIAIEKAEEEGDQKKIDKARGLHDAMMVFWKVRDTGKYPRVKMWFSSVGKSFRLGLTDEIYAPLKAAPSPGETVDENEEMF